MNQPTVKNSILSISSFSGFVNYAASVSVTAGLVLFSPRGCVWQNVVLETPTVAETSTEAQTQSVKR